VGGGSSIAAKGHKEKDGLIRGKRGGREGDESDWRWVVSLDCREGPLRSQKKKMKCNLRVRNQCRLLTGDRRKKLKAYISIPGKLLCAQSQIRKRHSGSSPEYGREVNGVSAVATKSGSET